VSSSQVALASDSAVPQRDHLLNLDDMASRLSQRLGSSGSLAFRSCEREFVSYRVGKRLRIVYRVGIDGEEVRVAASTFRSRSRSRRAYQAALERSPASGKLRPVWHDAELDSVFWTFPNDRRIANLGPINDVTEDLGQLLDGRWTASRLVDYYPETSAVVRCLDDSNRVIAYAKVHAGDDGERTLGAQRALVRAAKGSGLRIANPLAYSKRHRTLVVEEMSGPSIGMLKGAGLLKGLGAYGAALATLHSLPLVDIRASGGSALDRLRRKASGICSVRPDVEPSVSMLLDELSRRWERAAGDPVLVHGDTNENNAILQDGRVALIDFDRASIGSAGADIGNFLGLLRYFRALDIISPGSQGRRAASFVSGYSSVRPLPPPDSLQVHISAALAERAFRAVTRVRPRALVHVPALLSEANTLLHEGASA
jgi:aminoglycoside phosphotransferase